MFLWHSAFIHEELLSEDSKKAYLNTFAVAWHLFIQHILLQQKFILFAIMIFAINAKQHSKYTWKLKAISFIEGDSSLIISPDSQEDYFYVPRDCRSVHFEVQWNKVQSELNGIIWSRNSYSSSKDSSCSYSLVYLQISPITFNDLPNCINTKSFLILVWIRVLNHVMFTLLIQSGFWGISQQHNHLQDYSFYYKKL